MNELNVAAPTDSGTVEVRLPAVVNQLPLLRAIAEAVALLGDFDLDAAADTKLAVDEVCSLLIGRAAPTSALACRFTMDGDTFRFRAHVRSNDLIPLDTAGFGWQVLNSLVNSVAVTEEAIGFEGLGNLTIIDIMKVGSGPS